MTKTAEAHVSVLRFPTSPMGDLKALIKAKLLRRNSAAPVLESSKSSVNSARPNSQGTSNDAASSINTPSEAGGGGGDLGRSDSKTAHPTDAKDAATTRSTSPGRDSADAAASNDRPPTRTSTASAPDCIPEEEEGGAATGTLDSAAADSTGAPSVEGGEALAGSSQQQTSRFTPAGSPSGNDRQPPGLANANSSTTPALAINAPLPSINEHPTGTGAIACIPDAEPPAPALSLPVPHVPLNPAQLPTTASTADLPQPPVPTASSREYLADAATLDIAVTPSSPSVVQAYVRASPPSASRPGIIRRQSILPSRQQALIRTLLNTTQTPDLDPDQLLPISPNMVTRKIWVKRPGGSATMVTINEDDLVDDVRDMILRKYANSLGRQWDAPDLTIRIAPKEQAPRQLQPDEPMGRTLDAYFPGGQTVEDALLVDVPNRRTPKASPNPHYYGDNRPHESGTDYFPPYPPAAHAHHPGAAAAAAPAASIHFPPSMAIVGNGQLPPLPSPGGTRRQGALRPKMQRMHTASPVSTATTLVQHAPVQPAASIGTHVYSSRPQRSRTHSGASSDQSALPAHPHPPPAAPPMPTPPVPERVSTPPPRIASPRPAIRPKKKRTLDTPTLPPGMLNGAVPPINVLIVEDNSINLRLLEAFVKRLRVRWQTAMNGRDAVNKWRTGGFHLVLMDIQLPIMNGLEATREIRRIEKVNSIGVFSSSASSAPEEVQGEPDEQDKLPNMEMFKSPVIIVALTASSLQSDRHEALAAGCNDFLTKVC